MKTQIFEYEIQSGSISRRNNVITERFETHPCNRGLTQISKTISSSNTSNQSQNLSLGFVIIFAHLGEEVLFIGFMEEVGMMSSYFEIPVRWSQKMKTFLKIRFLARCYLQS